MRWTRPSSSSWLFRPFLDLSKSQSSLSHLLLLLHNRPGLLSQLNTLLARLPIGLEYSDASMLLPLSGPSLFASTLAASVPSATPGQTQKQVQYRHFDTETQTRTKAPLITPQLRSDSSFPLPLFGPKLFSVPPSYLQFRFDSSSTPRCRVHEIPDFSLSPNFFPLLLLLLSSCTTSSSQSFQFLPLLSQDPNSLPPNQRPSAPSPLLKRRSKREKESRLRVLTFQLSKPYRYLPSL